MKCEYECTANTCLLHLCLVSVTHNYLAAVDLAPSASDHTHSIANRIVVSIGLSWNPQIMARMVVVYWSSAQSGRPAGGKPNPCV